MMGETSDGVRTASHTDTRAIDKRSESPNPNSLHANAEARRRGSLTSVLSRVT